MGNLAVLFLNGEGGPQDHARGEHWAREGARLDNRLAIQVLAQLTAGRDPAEAARLFRRAIELGDPRAPALFRRLLDLHPGLRAPGYP